MFTAKCVLMVGVYARSRACNYSCYLFCIGRCRSTFLVPLFWYSYSLSLLSLTLVYLLLSRVFIFVYNFFGTYHLHIFTDHPSMVCVQTLVYTVHFFMCFAFSFTPVLIDYNITLSMFCYSLYFPIGLCVGRRMSRRIIQFWCRCISSLRAVFGKAVFAIKSIPVGRLSGDGFSFRLSGTMRSLLIEMKK